MIPDPTVTFRPRHGRDMLARMGRSLGGRGSLPGGEPPPGPISDWLRQQLLERRIILLTGELDEGRANETAAALLTLDAVSDEPIDLYVDSPDGTLGAAFALIDVLDANHAAVRIHCRGRLGGPAIGLLAACDRRVAAPHA